MSFCIYKNLAIIYFEADDIDRSYEFQGKFEVVKKWNKPIAPLFISVYEFNSSEKLPTLEKIFDKLDLPKDIFPEIIMPGEEIGSISSKVCSELEIKTIPVIAPAAHDTPSAVAGIPIVSKKLLPESLTVLT